MVALSVRPLSPNFPRGFLRLRVGGVEVLSISGEAEDFLHRCEVDAGTPRQLPRSGRRPFRPFVSNRVSLSEVLSIRTFDIPREVGTSSVLPSRCSRPRPRLLEEDAAQLQDRRKTTQSISGLSTPSFKASTTTLQEPEPTRLERREGWPTARSRGGRNGRRDDFCRSARGVAARRTPHRRLMGRRRRSRRCSRRDVRRSVRLVPERISLERARSTSARLRRFRCSCFPFKSTSSGIPGPPGGSGAARRSHRGWHGRAERRGLWTEDVPDVLLIFAVGGRGHAEKVFLAGSGR